MLAARVCAEIDHSVAHGKAIQVFAEGDHVTLRGVALRTEIDDVLNTACRVRGVSVVSNQLEVRDTAGKVLALQS
jgi:osmotically-inducible protein OsmY